MGISLALVAVAYLPFAWLERPAATPSSDVIASLVILGVVCTAVAFVAFGALIGEVGPVRATIITYLNPAVAAALGVLILDESVTPGMIVGLVLVLIGSALATRSGTTTTADADAELEPAGELAPPLSRPVRSADPP
jgi:drug/metabolite transporter (DMT)-like permease